jgi:predicted DCC family thiol-disulfide oxidoreductase YuxK
MFRFAPLGGSFASRVVAGHRHLEGVDSLILVEPAVDGSGEEVFVRSGALLRGAAHLGGAWRALAVLRVIPRPLRDWAYDLFARHRYRVWGRHETCPLPPAHVRERFLD